MEQYLRRGSNPRRERERIHSLGTSTIGVVDAIRLRSSDNDNSCILGYYRQSLISLLDDRRSGWFAVRIIQSV